MCRLCRVIRYLKTGILHIHPYIFWSSHVFARLNRRFDTLRALFAVPAKSAFPIIMIYKCPQCSDSFTRQFRLNEHLDLHNGIRLFVCSKCPRSFTRNHDRMNHERSHTKEKPFICSRHANDGQLGCHKAFSRMSTLRRHQRTVCNKTLTQLLSKETSPRGTDSDPRDGKTRGAIASNSPQKVVPSAVSDRAFLVHFRSVISDAYHAPQCNDHAGSKRWFETLHTNLGSSLSERTKTWSQNRQLAYINVIALNIGSSTSPFLDLHGKAQLQMLSLLTHLSLESDVHCMMIFEALLLGRSPPVRAVRNEKISTPLMERIYLSLGSRNMTRKQRDSIIRPIALYGKLYRDISEAVKKYKTPKEIRWYSTIFKALLVASLELVPAEYKVLVTLSVDFYKSNRDKITASERKAQTIHTQRRPDEQSLPRYFWSVTPPVPLIGHTTKSAGILQLSPSSPPSNAN